MMPSGVVTLTTDFGLTDPFVGVMKGAILRCFPEATIVDLCHAIPPLDIATAAFWVSRCFQYFSPGTVHVAVVDPGVGSTRRPIAIRARDQYFIGPDNGIFSGILANFACEVRLIEPQLLGLRSLSHTFHGRDLFGPVAAILAAWGVSFAQLGPVVADLEHLSLSKATLGSDSISGTILFTDHFGNAFTNIDESLLGAGRWRVRVGELEFRYGKTYAEGAPNEALALVNSFGVLELAATGAHAKNLYQLTPGACVTCSKAG